MGTRAQCGCGWQLELSDFYAGKQIRCQQCENVVIVPGKSTTPLYNSPLPVRSPGPGRWVKVNCWGETCGAVARPGAGAFGFALMIFALIFSASMLDRCGIARPAAEPGQQLKPAPKEAPAEAPASPEREQDF